jgi:hypothetical protein
VIDPLTTDEAIVRLMAETAMRAGALEDLLRGLSQPRRHRPHGPTPTRRETTMDVTKTAKLSLRAHSIPTSAPRTCASPKAAWHARRYLPARPTPLTRSLTLEVTGARV